MAPPSKLIPKTPGEPLQELESTEQHATEAEQQAAQAEQAPAEPVVELAPGELPDQAAIDPKKITKTVLTKQGYVLPEVR